MFNSSQRIGEFLVTIGVMSEEQVEKVLMIQKKDHDKLFGEIAIEMGFIDDGAIDRYLSSRSNQDRKPRRLKD